MWEGIQALKAAIAENKKRLYLSDGIDDCYGALSKEPAVPVCLHIRQGQADFCVIFHKQEKSLLSLYKSL